jgi:Putative beta-barrel porin 2
MALCLLVSCRLSVAIDPGTIPNPVNPASANADLSAPVTPAVMALPANNAPLSNDASSNRKFYTLTASLREIYDDNVGTVKNNPQTSYETELSPSVLVDFPTEDGDFSARYTFNITYYSVGPDTNSNNNNNSGKNSSEFKYTHEFIAQYSHAFSERFNLALAEQFRYYIEPSLYESTGTNYQNGAYISNAISGTLSAQWTPLFGTTTTYSNTIVRYDNSLIAQFQDSIENTGSQVFSFTVAPKVSVNFGGIVDDLSYDQISRGYTNYTGFVGAQWQILPSLSVTGRGGASYTEEIGDNQPLISPYAALSVDWTLGARSSLSFNYAHEVTPTDQVSANGQTSDRFTANFRYDITSSLSSHLQGVFTQADVQQGLINSASISSYNESDYALDTGLTYHYNSYLDIDCGITLSGVSSDIMVNDYSRDEAYVGVRGTY